MPTKTYYSVAGEIIAEETGGVRTDYITDAVGSIVGTVDPSQAVVNTYRYKPYGGLLAKTGTAPDPRFLWAGNSGARTTNLNRAEQYKGTRHYAEVEARRLSRDSSVHAYYGIGRGNPNRRMPLGQTGTCDLSKVTPTAVPFKLVTMPSKGICASYGEKIPYKIDWDVMALRQLTQQDGWIIQEILLSSDVKTCDTPQKRTCVLDWNYWEAWYVQGNRILIGKGFLFESPSDFWVYGRPCRCAKGEKTTDALAKFNPVDQVCADKDHWNWTESPDKNGRGNLLGSEAKPPGWSRDAPATHRTLIATSACCRKCEKISVCIEPPPETSLVIK